MLFRVENMSCGHCVRAITATIHALEPRATVDVDLAGGTVRIAGSLDAEAAVRAIREEGYPARLIEG